MQATSTRAEIDQRPRTCLERVSQSDQRGQRRRPAIFADRATSLNHRQRGERARLSSAIGRRDDHTPVRIVAFGTSADSLDLAQRIVDDLAIGRRHRLEHTGDAGLLDLIGHLHREPIECFLASLAIATDVDAQARVVIAEATLRCDPGKILHRLQRGATRADQQAEILAVHTHLEIVAVLDQFSRAGERETRRPIRR